MIDKVHQGRKRCRDEASQVALGSKSGGQGASEKCKGDALWALRRQKKFGEAKAVDIHGRKKFEEAQRVYIKDKEESLVTTLLIQCGGSFTRFRASSNVLII